jgi:hypothetical protein
VTADNQLRMLTKHADQYRQLSSGSGDGPIARFGKRMALWETSPTHPLALRIASSGLPPAIQTQMFDDIVSYIVRRAMCGLTAKNYNNFFLQLLKRINIDLTSANGLRDALSAQKSDVSRWPTDDEFRRAWLQDAVHQRFGEAARIRVLLSELENGFRSPRAEEPFTPGSVPLDIDHILREKWYTHWPLNGDAITEEDASKARLRSLTMTEASDEVDVIVRREKLKATVGNLTLIHYGINRSLQNGPFTEKRDALFAESNLHLNRMLMRVESWDEAAIERRGSELFEIARRIWRGPTPSEQTS